MRRLLRSPEQGSLDGSLRSLEPPKGYLGAAGARTANGTSGHSIRANGTFRGTVCLLGAGVPAEAPYRHRAAHQPPQDQGDQRPYVQALVERERVE